MIYQILVLIKTVIKQAFNELFFVIIFVLFSMQINDTYKAKCFTFSKATCSNTTLLCNI